MSSEESKKMGLDTVSKLYLYKEYKIESNKLPTLIRIWRFVLIQKPETFTETFRYAGIERLGD